MKFLDRGLIVVTGLCALGAMGMLLSLLIAIIGGGISRISWDFLSLPMEGVMGGGVRYQILGIVRLQFVLMCI